MEYSVEKLLESYQQFIYDFINEPEDVVKNYYRDVTLKMQHDFSNSEFIKQLNGNLKNYN